MMNIRNTFREKDGVALLTVVLIFLVMVIMVAGMSVWSMGNMTNSKVSNEHTAAFYAAEAGVNKTMAELDGKINLLTNDSNQTNVTPDVFFSSIDSLLSGSSVLNLTSNSGQPTSATVSFTKDGVNADGFTIYRIVSVGTVGDVSRTLEKIITMKYTQGTDGTGFTIDKAVLATAGIKMENNAEVNSADPEKDAIVASYSSVTNSLNFANNAKVTKIQVLPNNINAVVSNFQKFASDDLENIQYPIISMPEVPLMEELAKLPSVVYGTTVFINNTGSMSKTDNTAFTNRTYIIPPLPSNQGFKGYYVPSMSFGGTNTFTIHTDSNVYILTDSLSISGNIRFSGEGKVTIYVRGNSQVNPPSDASSLPFYVNLPNNGATVGRYRLENGIAKPDNPQKFLVYVENMYQTVSGSVVAPTIVLSNNSSFFGSYYFLNANFTMQNNSGVVGYFVTGGEKVLITNNGSIGTTLYYAPNAFFEMSNNAKIDGAVITKSVLMNQGAKVTYNPVAFANFPFQIFDPNAGGNSGTGPSVISFVVGPTVEH